MNKLSAQDRSKLLAQFAGVANNKNSTLGVGAVKVKKSCNFKDFLLYKKIQAHSKVAEQMGIPNPFMQCHGGMAKAHTNIEGVDYINFATYDYLGLNGDKRINDAAFMQMEQYGTSCGSSRLVAGERPVHRALEQAIADHYGTESALCFVSGHATNVTVISTLFNRDDLILYDRLSHNSILLGAKDSGATILAFKHNDIQSLRELLIEQRGKYNNCLIVTEGVFSMDGDIPDLPALVALKKEFDAFLMIDEAHSLGVIGNTGRGICEYYNIPTQDVDIIMGTLSKTLCACGGYVAGKKELIEMLEYYAPGFVYSVGLSPALAGASLKAMELLHSEPERVQKLQANCLYAKNKAKELGLDIGSASATAVLPVIIGSSLKATILSNLLFQHGILALPIIFPVVEEAKARIRFFLSASHTSSDIDRALEIVKELLPEVAKYEAQFTKTE